MRLTKIIKLTLSGCKKCQESNQFDSDIFKSYYPDIEVEIIDWDEEDMSYRNFYMFMCEEFSTETVDLPLYIFEFEDGESFKHFNYRHCGINKWELGKFVEGFKSK
jgi:hypothetical protein